MLSQILTLLLSLLWRVRREGKKFKKKNIAKMSFYLVSCWKCLIAMSGVSELCTAAWAPEMLLLRLSVSLWVSQEMFGGGCEPCEDKRVRAGSPVCEQHRLQRGRESGRAGSRELKIIHPYHGTAAHWAELLFWTCYAISTCWDCSVWRAVTRIKMRQHSESSI